jgi:hypothetical protein
MIIAFEVMSEETKGNETLRSLLIKAEAFRLHTHLALEQKEGKSKDFNEYKIKGKRNF